MRVRCSTCNEAFEAYSTTCPYCERRLKVQLSGSVRYMRDPRPLSVREVGAAIAVLALLSFIFMAVVTSL